MTEQLVSAILLIRGEQDAELYETFSRLAATEGICGCDSVVGDWDIVAQISSTDRKKADQLIKDILDKLSGIEQYEIYHCQAHDQLENDTAQPVLGEQDREARNFAMPSHGGNAISAYALLDIDPINIEQICESVGRLDAVRRCHIADPHSKIILFMQGESIDAIRSIISNKISYLSGVLRVKVMRVLYMSINH
jgi:DNA-binding Lrp family transcriptional regulator